MILNHHTPDGVRRSRHQSLELYGLPAAAGSPAVAEALDDIVRVARSFTGADGATVTLLPDGRQVTIAATAAESPSEIPEAHSVCATLLEQRPVSTIVVHDLSRDHRFADNPYVVGAGGIRGFSSTPLVGHERVAIGTLCLWSLTPRGLTVTRCRCSTSSRAPRSRSSTTPATSVGPCAGSPSAASSHRCPPRREPVASDG